MFQRRLETSAAAPVARPQCKRHDTPTPTQFVWGCFNEPISVYVARRPARTHMPPGSSAAAGAAAASSWARGQGERAAAAAHTVVPERVVVHHQHLEGGVHLEAVGEHLGPGCPRRDVHELQRAQLVRAQHVAERGDALVADRRPEEG
jgi:hypothetical protein